MYVIYICIQYVILLSYLVMCIKTISAANFSMLVAHAYLAVESSEREDRVARLLVAGATREQVNLTAYTNLS